jgi:hypothetical protein
MSARAAATAMVLAALAACSGSPPPPVPVASATPPPAAAGPIDAVDPAEPGISDLARLARYVFRTMQRHEDVCPFENPFRDQVHFALAVEVKAGRMARVSLGHLGHAPEGGGQAHPVPREQFPPELMRYVSCLEPHLEAVVMSPSPADGAYEPAYSFPGNPAGRAAH